MIMRSRTSAGASSGCRLVAEGRVEREPSLQLVAAVAHEMQTPLAAVRGAARTLARDDRLDEVSRRKLLQVIEDAAAQLALLAEELTLAGRLEAGRLPIGLEPCEVGPLLDAVVSAARSGRPGAEIETSLPREPPRVLADPAWLRRSLAELVENALKHGGGSPVRIDVTVAEGRVRIAVGDEGPGIPADQAERIFEPYVRLGERVSGSGLGLAIARDLVRAMGGELTVVSRPGRGSTFTIELPAA